MFLKFFFFDLLVHVTPRDKTTRSEMEASLRLLATSSFYVCVYADSCTVAAAASLVFATCNSERFDGTGTPATKQDKCYRLTRNHSADF